MISDILSLFKVYQTCHISFVFLKKNFNLLTITMINQQTVHEPSVKKSRLNKGVTLSNEVKPSFLITFLRQSDGITRG